jgi:hypothetical protein
MLEGRQAEIHAARDRKIEQARRARDAAAKKERGGSFSASGLEAA